MESDFDPKEYLYRNNARFPVDGTFWTKIKSADGINPIDKQGFSVPSSALYGAWPDILKLKYGIEEDIFYDPKISGLVLEVTPEMIQKCMDSWYKDKARLIDSKTKEVIDTRPKNMTPEQFLESEKIRIFASQSARTLGRAFGNNDIPNYVLTEWDKKVVQWRQAYGFLVDKEDMSGFLFPQPKDLASLKQEVEREYLFNIPRSEYSGVILSLAQEPNSNRAIWGFRRDFATDWPREFPKEYVVEMSNLMRNLEGILK